MAKNEDFNSVNPVNQPSEKTCKGKCGKLKPLSDYNNNRTKKDGKQEICRECQSDFMRDYNARKAHEHRMQLTAGDVELDPKPAPITTKGKEVRNDLMKKHVMVDHRDHVKVNLPDKKVAKQAENGTSKVGKVNFPDKAIKQEVQAIVKEVAAMPRADKPLHLTDEEKSILIASLDRHVSVIEKIIEKLSS